MEEKDYLFLEIGTILNNRYQVEKILGERSNFSIVYKGIDLYTKDIIAIKEFFPKNIVLRDMDKKTIICKNSCFENKFLLEIENFLNEGEMLTLLKNKGIVNCLDYFRENGTAYIVMQYHDGNDLEKHIQNNEFYDCFSFLDRIIVPLINSIDFIQKRGYLHRDIKPSNIIIENNQPVLLDFGSAVKYIEDKDKKILVTPGFSPLEFYSEKSCQNESSDIYSIAAMIYYFISGETPPEATCRIIEDNLNTLEQYNLPFLLEKLIIKNLSLNAKRRDKSLKKIKYTIKIILITEKLKNIFIKNLVLKVKKA